MVTVELYVILWGDKACGTRNEIDDSIRQRKPDMATCLCSDNFIFVALKVFSSNIFATHMPSNCDLMCER